MEVEKFVFALQETISCLRRSEPADASHMPVEEMIRRLDGEIAKARNATPVDIILLDRLFAPTGALQKISINDGWGTKFVRISETVDQFIMSGQS